MGQNRVSKTRVASLWYSFVTGTTNYIVWILLLVTHFGLRIKMTMMLFNVTAELTGLAHIEPVGRDWTDPSHAYNIKVCCVVLGFDFLFHPRWLVWIIYFCCVVSGFDFLFHPRWLVWIVYFCCVVLGLDFLFHPRWSVWIVYFCCVVSGFDFLFHPRWLVWIVYFCCVVSGLDFLFPSSLIGLDRILLLVFGSGELFWGGRSSVAMLFGFSLLFFSFFREFFLIAGVFFFIRYY